MKRLMIVCFLCLLSLHIIGCDKVKSFFGGNVNSSESARISPPAPEDTATQIERNCAGAKQDVKNAYTAAVAFLTDHPNAKISSIHELEKEGFSPTKEVNTVIIYFGDADNFKISSKFSGCDKTYYATVEKGIMFLNSQPPETDSPPARAPAPEQPIPEHPIAVPPPPSN